MTVALITINPYAILGTFPDGTTQFRLPSGDVVEGAALGLTAAQVTALIEAANQVAIT
jgi:hypothetical protein